MSVRRENRARARNLYIYDALPLSVIAGRTGVSERTLMRWKTEDGDWDKGRIASRLAKDNIETSTQEYLEKFLVYQQNVLRDVEANPELTTKEKVAAISSLADAYTKTVRACTLTAPTLSRLAVAMDVLQKLASYIGEKHPDVAPILVAVLEPFGYELAKHYG